MTTVPALTNRSTESRLAPMVARLIVGGVFVWLSVNKIQHPIEFLKVLREYQLLPESPPQFLNLTAVTLPWIELLVGILLIAGFW